MKSKYWLYLFFADLLAELAVVTEKYEKAVFFTKPLLMFFLFGWFMLSSLKFSPLRYCIAAALFFSWLGDIFLLMESHSAIWFIAGLGSFLTAHVMYTIFFLQARTKQAAQKPWRVITIVVIGMYCIALYAFLYPHTGNLKIPVAIYALVISAMLMAAAHAFMQKIIAAWCVSGAVLFIVSDSLLAVNKFYHEFPAAGVLIMASYGLAQFAIAKGSLLYLAGLNKVLDEERPGT